MRRSLWIAPAVAAVGVSAVCFFKSVPLPANAGKGVESNAPAAGPKPELPIRRVILFSSGVGYFQREGKVDGNARINLSFPVQDVNDLLKSMVLQDLGGGHISAVNYDSHDPIDKTLKSFAVNLTNNPTFAQLLNQARGEKVEVVLQQSAATQAGTVTGIVVGMEKQKQKVGKDIVLEVEMLNLWCADGMRSLRLADVQRVHFLNPVLEQEFKRALDVLALSHDRMKKMVSLTFAGQGKRQVRVGYVVENPIWKTSYRLVLGKKDKPFLQGWAIVENPTDEDWSRVHMTLISGRPISFQMDLYQPLYVRRPVVEPELFASLRPQTYGRGVEGGEGIGGGFLDDKGRAAREATAAAPMGGKITGLEARQKELQKNAAISEGQLQKSIQSSATAAELGDFFQYAIDHPVSLPRQKSALLPIINQDIEGAKVSIYNESVQSKFPMLGLKFKNTTSAVSQLNFRVDRFQFCPGVIDFHLPIHAALHGVYVGGPGGGFRSQGLDFRKSLV